MKRETFHIELKFHWEIHRKIDENSSSKGVDIYHCPARDFEPVADKLIN